MPQPSAVVAAAVTGEQRHRDAAVAHRGGFCIAVLLRRFPNMS